MSIDGQPRGSYSLKRATTGKSGGYASLWAKTPVVVDWLRVVECGP